MNSPLARRVAAIGAGSLIAALATVATGATPASATSQAAPVRHNMLLKQLLSEEAEVPPEAPSLHALCQEFLGKPNPYADPSPNVDQIVGDTVVQLGTQTGCNAAQNETTIAVNPRNPRNIVAGANDYRVFNSRERRNDSSGWAYTTFDGGSTWQNIQLPGLTFQTGGVGAFQYFDAAGDPVLAFGADNTVYYGNIAFSRTPFQGGQLASGIVVNVSHDGGLTWSDPKVIQLDGVTPEGTPVRTDIFNDKIWLAADPSSGTAYVTWTKFTFDSAGNYIESPIVVSASSDFGDTWSAQRRVSPSLAGFGGGVTPYAQGSNPQIGNDGTLYIAHEASVCATAACNLPTDHDATVVSTSTDGGVTFQHAEVGINFDFPLNDDTGSPGLTGENFRINSYPQLAYDRVTGRLWVTWADDRNGKYTPTGKSVRTNGDNLVSSSTNGRVWSTPEAVGTDQDEVFGAIAAYGGTVAVSSYTRNYDANGINLDYAYWQRGRNGFASAAINRITTQSQNPQVQFVGLGLKTGRVLQGLFIGDYSAMAIGSDRRIHPCWTDFRGRPGTNTPNQDAYTQSVRLGGDD